MAGSISWRSTSTTWTGRRPGSIRRQRRRGDRSVREYVLRRVGLSIPTMFLVAVVTFFTMHVLPGDAALVKAAGTQDQDQGALYQAYRHALGLDRHIYVQFGDWLWRVIRYGDLGTSYGAQDSVRHQILSHLPVTLELAA